MKLFKRTESTLATVESNDRREQSPMELIYDTVKIMLDRLRQKQGKYASLFEYITVGDYLDSNMGLRETFDTQALKGFLFRNFNGMKLTQYEEDNLQSWYLIAYNKYIEMKRENDRQRRLELVGPERLAELELIEAMDAETTPLLIDGMIIGLEDEDTYDENAEV